MITIVAYKPSWRDEFAQIGKQLRIALGDLALRVDHIGSTAVPGLAAKDRIDIQITASALTLEISDALQRAGYQRSAHITHDHVPPGASPDPSNWEKWFFKPVDPDSAINVHVRLPGRTNQQYPLLFRDYLRAHPSIAAAYAQVKQQLVAHKLDDPDAYYDIKDPVCDIIVGGAEGWATVIGWQPGPSDC